MKEPMFACLMSTLPSWPLLFVALLVGVIQCFQSKAAELDHDKFAVKRTSMVKTQIEARGVSDQRVLRAMLATPRHEFVPDELKSKAYEDSPLPIGHGQTISQPYIVALMTEALRPREHERVLEIGTGSGYQAAVLSPLVKEVFTMEIVEPLAQRAAATLARLGYLNVLVRAGDGWLGWPEKAPFDAIIVTCAPDKVPPALKEQLKDGGRMVIPVGKEGEVQQLILLEKNGASLNQRALLPVRFVPMTGARPE